MNGPTLTLFFVRTRIAFERAGRVMLTSVAICFIGLVLWFDVIADLREKARFQQAILEELQAASGSKLAPTSAITLPLAEQHAQQFYASLGEKKSLEQQIQVIFDTAREAGLAVDRGEYRAAFSQAGGFYTYQIRVPVKGSYRAIRQFCDRTLLTIPYASLDEASFKREAVSNNELEASLRFTLYLNDVPPDAERLQSADAPEGVRS